MVGLEADAVAEAIYTTGDMHSEYSTFITVTQAEFISVTPPPITKVTASPEWVGLRRSTKRLFYVRIWEVKICTGLCFPLSCIKC